MENQIRKVVNGSINIFGEKFKSPELKAYNGYEVILKKSRSGCGFDIYSESKFICYIQTVNPQLKGE